MEFFLRWKRLFFFHRQWLSKDASKNAFDVFWWAECCDLTRFWDVLVPNYFYQIRLYKIGNALKDTGSAFFLLCDKTHTRCRHRSSVCASNNRSLFLLNNFLYNCTLLKLDLTPGKVGYVALSMWLADIHTLTWFTEIFPVIVTMLFFTTTFRC